MRGMIDGKWHRNLAAVQGWNDGVASSFRTIAPSVGIDVDRMRERPHSYHLYAALACPFAHRALIGHSLFNLAGRMGVTLAHPWLGGPSGWIIAPDNAAPVPKARALWQVYYANDTNYTGRVTVPVLWDCDQSAIASTDSAEILSSFVAAYAGRGGNPEVIPATRHQDLRALCLWIKDRINIGVYRIGFAKSQSEYDAAHDAFSEALNELELRASGQRYLWGDALSEADLLLFATAIRFDAAYHGAFQILDLRWRDFPGLYTHLRTMFSVAALQRTISIPDYRTHYFDDDIFPIRHPDTKGRYIIPRTPEPIISDEKRM